MNRKSINSKTFSGVIWKSFPVFLLLMFTISFVSADYSTTIDGKSTLVLENNASFDFLSWFRHTFGITQFSVVGDSQNADRTPRQTWTATTPQSIFINVPSLCTSGHGLLDVFVPNYGTPYMEYKDNFNGNEGIWLGSGGIIELYCVAHPEPTSNSNCQSWVGADSIKKTATCVASGKTQGGYYCTADGVTESAIPYNKNSFGYCSDNVYRDCWYVSGSTCEKRHYSGETRTCSQIGTYGGATLYSSLSTCQSNIPVTCTSFAYSAWGTCNNGVQTRTVTSSSPSGCTGGSPVLSQSCTTSTPNNWVTSPSECTGTKPIGCADKRCVATAAECGTCEWTCPSYGAKECNNGQSRTCALQNSNCGSWTNWTNDSTCATNVTAPTGVSDIRVTIQVMPNNYVLGTPDTFTLTLKNFGDKAGTINVEAGFYSPNYAKNVAQLYSSFPIDLFSVVLPTPNCNPAENFVATKSVQLDSGESTTITLTINPETAFVTYPNAGEYDLKAQPLTSFWGLYTQCLGGYTNEAGKKGKGGMFDYDQNYPVSCGSGFLGLGDIDVFCDGADIGDCYGTKLTLTNTCQITSTVDVVLKNVTPTITTDQIINQTGLSGMKKVSLTEDEISSATNDVLFTSSCLQSTECLPKVNYSTSCVTISSLRGDGTLDVAKTTSFFNKVDTITSSALTGAGLGIGVGILGCIGGNLLTATGVFVEVGLPLAVISCPALFTGATSVGGAIVGAAAGNIISANPSDPLLKKLQAHDENSVGICTAEPELGINNFIKSLAFISITGNKTTDGFIIAGLALFFILIIFLRK